MDSILVGLSLVVVLSILARLGAAWLRVPAIVPLLVVGVLAGTSVTDLVNPTKLLGDALNPAVEIAVAVILFEGALSLKLGELAAGVRPAVFRLVTAGIAITWMLATCAVVVLFDVPPPVAVLIGAVLIVTGPTVVLPLLNFIGPPGRVRSVLKWEGVLTDPIGAIIAVVIFGSLVSDRGRAAFDLVEIVASLGTGLIVGMLGALLLLPLLGARRLSGRDKVAATLMMIVACFALANTLFEDSGLLAALIMGAILANQKRARIENISEFKETLVPILIGILFVLLAANVDLGQVWDLGWEGLALVVFLIVAVRPLAVVTTLGLPFEGRERAFFAGIAPRGIVAASTASVFGLQLVDQGVRGAEKIIPITFLVIAGTVLVYSFASPPLAKLLGLAGDERPRLLIVGGPAWAMALGAALEDAGAEVSVWTEDPKESRAAEDAGLVPFGGPLDTQLRGSPSALQEISAVALVSADEALNQVLAAQFTENFEAEQVFRLRSVSDAAPIVTADALPLFADLESTAEIERRLTGGERMISFEPGQPIPPGATPIASVTPRSGPVPASIRLASTNPDRLFEKDAGIIALAAD